ncbi:MAG: DUF488 family protein, partial [Verrucomicrobiae bacterium]|nr:DUF488 family protein [Verrucomicrobiae bacterium]
MRIRAVQLGSPRKRGEGIRIGTVRWLPRGVKKKDYAAEDYFDVWLPALAPSRNLLAWAKERDIVENDEEWKRFAGRCERELLKDTDCRQNLILLAETAKKTPISIGCYCENESRCHRSILLKLIKRAGTKAFQF